MPEFLGPQQWLQVINKNVYFFLAYLMSQYGWTLDKAMRQI
jgi:hypothetical protein